MNKKGFTLIELLVVIAIIGILSTLSVIALNNARQKSRDARRVADVKQVQTALELYYNDENQYPTDVTFDGTSSIVGPTSSTTYMSVVPSNPEPRNDGTGGDQCTNANYIYDDTNSGASYVLRYCLGSETGGIAAGEHKATPAGIEDD